VQKLAIALTTAALAALALTGCSTTPPDDASQGGGSSTSKPADPNAPRGFVITATVNPSQTDTGETLGVGSGEGFEYIHSGAAPKLYMTALEGDYMCQVQDHITLEDATAYANGDLSEGKDDFLKEETGEAFAVTLKDRTAKGEAHRFIAPAKGTGLLVSCFGDKGETMIVKAWEWMAGNVEVAVVSAAEEGKIAAPSAN